MDITIENHHTEYDNIYKYDDLPEIAGVILLKSNNQSMKKQLNNQDSDIRDIDEQLNTDEQTSYVMISSKLDTQLLFLKGKTNKLSQVIQSRSEIRNDLADTIRLYTDTIPATVSLTVKNKQVRTEPAPVFIAPVSGEKTTIKPKLVIGQAEKSQFPAMTVRAASPATDTLPQTNNRQFTDNIQVDDTERHHYDNKVLFQPDNSGDITKVATEKPDDVTDINNVNDIIPVLYAEKSLMEYQLLSAERADVQTKLRRNIPLPAQQQLQHNMDANYTRPGYYFSYAFKMQGDYHEMIHIYRQQQQRFILEASPERLKRQLKESIRHDHKYLIDVV